MYQQMSIPEFLNYFEYPKNLYKNYISYAVTDIQHLRNSLRNKHYPRSSVNTRHSWENVAARFATLRGIGGEEALHHLALIMERYD